MSLIAKARAWRSYFYAVPWCVPSWGWPELVATARCMLTGSLVKGDASKKLAQALCAMFGTAHALPVNRGRTAVELALRAAGIGPGDDVVLPSYVCDSVLEAVTRVGARPAFADVGGDLNVTAASMEAALTDATRAVIVPHLFGNPAPTDEIERRLRGRGILLIDDAAQAVGARLGGRLVGTFGDVGIVSCGGGKPLSGAAGGAMLTNDRDLYARASSIALDAEPWKAVLQRTAHWWVERRMRRWTLPFLLLTPARWRWREPPHVPAHLSNVDAAIMMAQLRSHERRIRQRRRNASQLLELFSELRPARVRTHDGDAATKLVFILPPGSPDIKALISAFAAVGVETQSGYLPLHRAARPDMALPLTDALWQRVLCVPVESKVPRRRLGRRMPVWRRLVRDSLRQTGAPPVLDETAQPAIL